MTSQTQSCSTPPKSSEDAPEQLRDTPKKDSNTRAQSLYTAPTRSPDAVARQLRLPLEQVFTAAHGDGGPSERAAPDGGTALYYVAPDRILAADSDDAGLVRLTSALRELAHSDDGYEHSKASLHDFLCARGVPPEMLMLAQASYANTLGAGRALDELPLAAVSRLERLWASDGEGDYRFRDSVGALTEGPCVGAHRVH